MTYFSDIIGLVTSFTDVILNFVTAILDFFTTPLGDVSDIIATKFEDIPVFDAVGSAIETAVEFLGVGDVTIFTLFFSYYIIIIVGYQLVTWILNIVT